MFVLKKVLNSNSNCAEPVRMLTDSSSSYAYGDLLKISGDGTVVSIAAGDIPTHISIQTLAKGEAKSILCYRLTPDLVFEGRYNSMPNNSIIGKKFAVAIVDGHTVAMTGSEDNGIATIYSLGSAVDEGDRLLVIFDN